MAWISYFEKWFSKKLLKMSRIDNRFSKRVIALFIQVLDSGHDFLSALGSRRLKFIKEGNWTFRGGQISNGLVWIQAGCLTKGQQHSLYWYLPKSRGE